MFSTVSGKNCAIGKGAATTEDVLDELTRNKENEDTSNLGMDFVEMEQIISTSFSNNEGTSQRKRKEEHRQYGWISRSSHDHRQQD